MRVGRLHKIEDSCALVILEHEGRDIRATIPLDGVTFHHHNTNHEVLEIKPDAQILEVLWLKDRHNPPVVVPEKIEEQIVALAQKTVAVLKSP